MHISAMISELAASLSASPALQRVVALISALCLACAIPSIILLINVQRSFDDAAFTNIAHSVTEMLPATSPSLSSFNTAYYAIPTSETLLAAVFLLYATFKWPNKSLLFVACSFGSAVVCAACVVLMVSHTNFPSAFLGNEQCRMLVKNGEMFEACTMWYALVILHIVIFGLWITMLIVALVVYVRDKMTPQSSMEKRQAVTLNGKHMLTLRSGSSRSSFGSDRKYSHDGAADATIAKLEKDSVSIDNRSSFTAGGYISSGKPSFSDGCRPQTTNSPYFL
ncbi:hypothetical protein GQ42DRAFT_55898 [Ramicandelaber brevisporus]|nr:hypothetical protein GQ42DRAFT_55898 [Ramicandelaber brevisporus]